PRGSQEFVVNSGRELLQRCPLASTTVDQQPPYAQATFGPFIIHRAPVRAGPSGGFSDLGGLGADGNGAPPSGGFVRCPLACGPAGAKRAFMARNIREPLVGVLGQT